MEYVKVINPGETYTTIATEQNIAQWGAIITNNELPATDVTYRVIKEFEHPERAGTFLMTIMNNVGYAYIINVNGVTESTEEEYYYSIPKASKFKRRASEAFTHLSMPVPESNNRKYKVGDIIIITDPDSSYFNKKYRVTDPSYPGYDIVTSRNDTGSDKALGFKFSQFKLFEPEPELLPDDKPKFSKNELLQVLNQVKSAEEIVLDLMDHITN